MAAPAQPDALINAIEGFSAPLNGFCPGYRERCSMTPPLSRPPDQQVRATRVHSPHLVRRKLISASVFMKDQHECHGATPPMAHANVFKASRFSIVCGTSENNLTMLQISQAYFKLMCIPEGDARAVSIAWIGTTLIGATIPGGMPVSQAATRSLPLRPLQIRPFQP
jgi:hypothetical protein